MKKISLKNQNLREVEQLSREQLKNVLGGFIGGTIGETETGTDSNCGPYECKCPGAEQNETIIACDEVSCGECEEMCNDLCYG